MAQSTASTFRQDALDITPEEVQQTTEMAVIGALPNTAADTGSTSYAPANFNRRTAAATFGAVLEVALGDGAAIALVWNGTRYAFQAPDGTTPLKGELAASFLLAATHSSWRDFVTRLLKKLTGLTTFPQEQLTTVKEILLGVTDTVVGGGIIGALFTVSTILADKFEGNVWASQILGIVFGFFFLGCAKLCVRGLAMNESYNVQIDNKPYSAVLADAAKHEFRDLISFRAWWRRQLPDIVTFGILAVWIDPFISAVGGSAPSPQLELGTNVALLATFFAQTDVIVAILKHGPPAVVKGKNAIVAKYRAITRN